MTPRAEDRQVEFSADGRPLVGMLHLPVAEAEGAGMVVCHAFGDERKCSALAMTRLARRFAAGGRAALRFDYGGCGDSPGQFADATVATRLADIRAAVQFLQSETGVSEVCLLGLRFGATLAARAAEDLPACASLVLIEPVPDGAQYIDAQIKRKRVRGMITRGQGGADAGEARAGLVDLDGYALRQETLDQMRTARIRAGEVGFGGRVLLVQASFNEKLRAETEGVRRAYEQGGAQVDVRALVLPPFWSRIDIVPTDALNETVAAWLEG